MRLKRRLAIVREENEFRFAENRMLRRLFVSDIRRVSQGSVCSHREVGKFKGKFRLKTSLQYKGPDGRIILKLRPIIGTNCRLLYLM
jgi:hypothetical protein